MTSAVRGILEVQRLFEQVGKAPAKVIGPATKKGAKIALNYAKAHVPEGVEWTTGQYAHAPGTLKKSLKIRKEKGKKGKSVYTIGPDASGWFAHFMDTGFTAPNGRFIPGTRFLRNSVDLNRGVIKETIVSEMAKELDKLR